MNKSKKLGKLLPNVIDLTYRQSMGFRKVEEIMSREVSTTAPWVSMEDAAKIMGEKHIGSLIVKKYRTPLGIVTERDLLSNILAKGRDPKEVKVKEVMSYPLITLCSTATIREAAQKMIKKKGRLAVFECGKLVGIVTASDLVHSLPEAPETELMVDDFMSKKIVTADEKKSIASITKVMGEKRIGSVIITSKEKPIGIFTERDLLTTFLAKGKALTMEVGKNCSSPLITALSGIGVYEAAFTMTSKHIRRLPITKDEELAGIVTARDLVEAYAK